MAVFWFTKIFDTPGAYGMETIDISRPGINGHRFKEIGKRGRPSTLRARNLFETREEVDAFIAALTDSKGSIIQVQNLLDESIYSVHLFHFTNLEPQAIVSSDPAYNWRVEFTLDVVRTS